MVVCRSHSALPSAAAMWAVTVGFGATLGAVLVVQGIVALLLARLTKRASDPATPGHVIHAIPDDVRAQVRWGRGPDDRPPHTALTPHVRVQTPTGPEPELTTHTAETVVWLNTALQRIFSDFRSLPDLRASVTEKLNAEFDSIAYASALVVGAFSAAVAATATLTRPVCVCVCACVCVLGRGSSHALGAYDGAKPGRRQRLSSAGWRAGAQVGRPAAGRPGTRPPRPIPFLPRSHIHAYRQTGLTTVGVGAGQNLVFLLRYEGSLRLTIDAQLQLPAVGPLNVSVALLVTELTAKV
jgi:hypothetical protein